jgi:formylglycine-generating enzyme required for sulfatase activity
MRPKCLELLARRGWFRAARLAHLGSLCVVGAATACARDPDAVTRTELDQRLAELRAEAQAACKPNPSCDADVGTANDAAAGTAAEVDVAPSADAELTSSADADAEGKADTSPTAAPLNMVAVGDQWVDRYEASLWQRIDGQPVDCAAVQDAVQAAIAAGATTDTLYGGPAGSYCQANPNAAVCAVRQFGAKPNCKDDIDCLDYPEGFARSGAATSLVYACSIEGVEPSRMMTWFQAVVACAASGKHLTTNAEWQLAALGTKDPGESPGIDGSCNTTSSKARPTGAGTACVSQFGVHDMVGNVDEWVSNWYSTGGTAFSGQSGPPQVPFLAYSDGLDAVRNWNGTAFTNEGKKWIGGLPAAALRGGHASDGEEAGVYAINVRNGPSDWGKVHGQRCARGRLL